MWQHYYYWYSRYFTPHLPLFAHGRCIVLVTTGHRSLIIRIIAYHSGDHSLKIQGFIGIVALQGSSGSTATVFIRWPYSLHTFDRVLRICQYIKFFFLYSCIACLRLLHRLIWPGASFLFFFSFLYIKFAYKLFHSFFYKLRRTRSKVLGL
jgi:hypothetical protein